MNAQAVDRSRALGRELASIHERLREDLGRLRAGLNSGTDATPDDRQTLWTHCIGFCTALTGHHLAEDGTAFAILARQSPN